MPILVSEISISALWKSHIYRMSDDEKCVVIYVFPLRDHRNPSQYPASPGRPGVKYLLQKGVSGKEILLVKSSRPLVTSLKWRSWSYICRGAWGIALPRLMATNLWRAIGVCSYMTGARCPRAGQNTFCPFRVTEVSILCSTRNQTNSHGYTLHRPKDAKSEGSSKWECLSLTQKGE